MRDRNSSYDERIPRRVSLPLATVRARYIVLGKHPWLPFRHLRRLVSLRPAPRNFDRPRNFPSISNRRSSRVEYIPTHRKQKTATMSTRHIRRILLAGRSLKPSHLTALRASPRIGSCRAGAPRSGAQQQERLPWPLAKPIRR